MKELTEKEIDIFIKSTIFACKKYENWNELQEIDWRLRDGKVIFTYIIRFKRDGNEVEPIYENEEINFLPLSMEAFSVSLIDVLLDINTRNI